MTAARAGLLGCPRGAHSAGVTSLREPARAASRGRRRPGFGRDTAGPAGQSAARPPRTTSAAAVPSTAVPLTSGYEPQLHIFFLDCNIPSTAFGCAHNICGFAAALRTGLLPCNLNQVRPERMGANLSAMVTSRLCPGMETQRIRTSCMYPASQRGTVSHILCIISIPQV